MGECFSGQDTAYMIFFILPILDLLFFTERSLFDILHSRVLQDLHGKKKKKYESALEVSDHRR